MIENVIRLDDTRIPEATSLEGLITHGMQDGTTKRVPTSLIYAAAQDAAQIALDAASNADDARLAIQEDLMEKLGSEEYTSTEYDEV